MIRGRPKKRFARLSKIIPLFFAVFFILIIFLISRSNFFNIKQIEIKGEKLDCADVEQVKNVSGLYGQNFFLLNSQKIREDLQRKFICAKNITLTRIFPDKVEIIVSARQPVATLLKLKDQQASPSSLITNIATPEASEIQDAFLVDSESVVFSQDMNNLNIPKIYINDSNIFFGKALDSYQIKNSLKILEKIQTFGVMVKKSWISQDFFIVNPDTLDPKIIFRLDGRIEDQLASLQLILAEAKIDLKELEFIDLRFDKPIVKFAPKKNG